MLSHVQSGLLTDPLPLALQGWRNNRPAFSSPITSLSLQALLPPASAFSPPESPCRSLLIQQQLPPLFIPITALQTLWLRCAFFDMQRRGSGHLLSCSPCCWSCPRLGHVLWRSLRRASPQHLAAYVKPGVGHLQALNTSHASSRTDKP